MKIFELVIGPEDYDRRWVFLRLVLLGMGLEFARNHVVGAYAAVSWVRPRWLGGTNWWYAWYLDYEHREWYLDTLVDAIRSWWATSGWNAGRRP